MALTPDEKAMLDKLTQKANEPDADDFDIEIWDETGAGARVPYHKGKAWLQKFGIDLPEEPAADAGDQGQGKPAKPASGGAAPVDTGGTAQRYFGPQRARKAG